MTQVIWNPAIQFELQKILDYLLVNYGVKSAEKFTDDFEQWVDAIVQNPYMVSREPSLDHYQTIYRGAVIHKYQKLIYKVEGDIIYFVDLWDTRRNPDSLVKRIK